MNVNPVIVQLVQFHYTPEGSYIEGSLQCVFQPKVLHFHKDGVTLNRRIVYIFIKSFGKNIL